MRRSKRWLVAVAVLAALARAAVSAHRLDEYLQASRISIAPDRADIEVDLTPGVALAEAIAREIDRDGSRSISSEEGAAYAEAVRHALHMDVDGIPLVTDLVDRGFPTPDVLRNGEGTIRLRLTAALPPLDAGPHQIRYRNDHHSDIGVYLANALVPSSSRVRLTGQHRDVNQRELMIGYVLRPEPALGTRLWLFGGVTSVLSLLFLARRRLR